MREVKVGQVWKWFEDDEGKFEVLAVGEKEATIGYLGDGGFVVDHPLFYWDAESVLVKDVEEPDEEEVEPLKFEDLKVGQLVIRKSDGWQRYITGVDGEDITHLFGVYSIGDRQSGTLHSSDFLANYRLPTIEEVELFKEDNPDLFDEPAEEENNQLSPNVYQFPNGVEVKDISAHLTSFGGQAVQYIARATRLDGVVKGLPVQDLYKAIELLKWEAERMEALQK